MCLPPLPDRAPRRQLYDVPLRAPRGPRQVPGGAGDGQAEAAADPAKVQDEGQQGAGGAAQGRKDGRGSLLVYFRNLRWKIGTELSSEAYGFSYWCVCKSDMYYQVTWYANYWNKIPFFSIFMFVEVWRTNVRRLQDF